MLAALQKSWLAMFRRTKSSSFCAARSTCGLPEPRSALYAALKRFEFGISFFSGKSGQFFDNGIGGLYANCQRGNFEDPFLTLHVVSLRRPISKCRSSSLPLLHHLHKMLEQVMRIVRAG